MLTFHDANSERAKRVLPVLPVLPFVPPPTTPTERPTKMTQKPRRPATWETAAKQAIQEINAAPITEGPLETSQVTNPDTWGHRTHILTLGRSALTKLQNQHPETNWPQRIVAIITAKQFDYGQQNILAFETHGLRVRISDKLARIGNLKRRGTEGQTEPLLDAYIDLVGYATIWLMLLDGTFTLPLSRETERALTATTKAA